jgi:16S rRNA (guanine966-N2)-methyltransferase
MRVISGTARGRRLQVPAGLSVRPTGDRVREALFSSISRKLRHAIVLDLFAGSGALGIESLSRGAAHATFVESERATVAVVRANLDAAEVAERAELVEGRALAFLRGPATTLFTLAFLDPPYAFEEQDLGDVLAALVAHLAPGAEVIVERDRKSPCPLWPPEMESTQERAYGSTRLHRAVHVPLADPSPPVSGPQPRLED